MWLFIKANFFYLKKSKLHLNIISMCLKVTTKSAIYLMAFDLKGLARISFPFSQSAFTHTQFYLFRFFHLIATLLQWGIVFFNGQHLFPETMILKKRGISFCDTPAHFLANATPLLMLAANSFFALSKPALSIIRG